MAKILGWRSILGMVLTSITGMLPASAIAMLFCPPARNRKCREKRPPCPRMRETLERKAKAEIAETQTIRGNGPSLAFRKETGQPAA
ncbi:hypothetical protein GCM10010837_30890 [Aminobacter niigataensis]